MRAFLSSLPMGDDGYRYIADSKTNCQKLVDALHASLQGLGSVHDGLMSMMKRSLSSTAPSSSEASSEAACSCLLDICCIFYK